MLDQQGETLAPGQYYLLAFTFADELAIELWPNAVWLTGGASIPLERAELVAVKQDLTTTADFSLDTMGGIAGRVIDAETGGWWQVAGNWRRRAAPLSR